LRDFLAESEMSRREEEDKEKGRGCRKWMGQYSYGKRKEKKEKIKKSKILAPVNADKFGL